MIIKNYIAVLKDYQDSKIVIMDKKDHSNNSHCTKNEVFTELQIWSHLLKKTLMENFIFCAVRIVNMIFLVHDNNL